MMNRDEKSIYNGYLTKGYLLECNGEYNDAKYCYTLARDIAVDAEDESAIRKADDKISECNQKINGREM